MKEGRPDVIRSPPGVTDELREERIADPRGLERLRAREFVVFAGRTLLGVGDRLLLPVRTDEVVALEAAHGGIDGAAGQTGHLHDAEAIDKSGVDGLEDEGCGMGEACFGCHGENIPM